MMGVGFGEMVIVAGIALVVIGPEKFPEFAKIALRTIRDLRGYLEDAKRDIAQELKPLQREVRELSKHNPEEYIDSLTGSVTAAMNDEPEPAKSSAENETKEGQVESTPEPAVSSAESLDLGAAPAPASELRAESTDFPPGETAEETEPARTPDGPYQD